MAENASEDTSNNSSAQPSRPGSVGTLPNQKQKPHHRVKFSVGADDEDEHQEPGSASHIVHPTSPVGEPPASDRPRVDAIPQIVVPPPAMTVPEDNEEDVASVSDVTLKTPNWSGRTNAAALHAQDRASRLASRLSHSAPGSRRNSIEDIRELPKSTYKPPEVLPKSIPTQRNPIPRNSPKPDTPRPGQTFGHVENDAGRTPLSFTNQAPGEPKRYNGIVPPNLPALPTSQKSTALQKKLQNTSDKTIVYPISPKSSPPQQPMRYPVKFDDIPLIDMSGQRKDRRPFSLYDDSTDDDSDNPEVEQPLHRGETLADTEARRLVRTMTRKLGISNHPREGPSSGTATPAIDKRLHDLEYVPPPTEYKAGILASLLKLYDQTGAGGAIQRQSVSSASHDPTTRKKPPKDIHDHGKYRSQSDTPGSSGPSSGPSTGPNSGKGTPHRKPKWYDKSPGGSPGASRSQSTSSMAHLLQSSVASAAPGLPTAASASGRPDFPRARSSGMIAAAVGKITHPHEALKSFKKPRYEDEVYIQLHIAAVLARQRYMIKLCRALMIFGAPTHRLEEYMRTTSRVLQIEGQFLYLPGCMVVSFDDPDTHTTEVKLVKEIQGVDLGKFKDTFTVYKNVLHDVWGVEEATQELEEIMARKPKFSVWIRVLVYGVASVSVGPFAFGARPIDFPIAFLLGCLLGVLQLIVAPKSEQFQHVFEVAAAVITSFLARAFGSITYHGEYIFCFSALAQSSIALILPGYIILCASLELQSRNIVAGSVRMVYAIIYSLFLGFGITIGTALFGIMDSRAVNKVTCSVPSYWENTFLTHFPFVPIFTLSLIIINQAKWHQAPAMLVIAFAGYQTNFWASERLANNVQVANALGAFVVGALANLYSRFLHGLAAAAMLPAIFVQVPSGLAASGSLVAGLTSAEQITGNVTGITVISNGTQGFSDAQNSTAAGGVYSGTIFNVGYGMVQVAIGISVGLFLSALVVYPVGKKRSGLFSF